MRALLTVLLVVCLGPVLSQRFVRQRVQPQYCLTPENYYGSCVTLSFCPQVVNVFQTANPRLAQQYVIALQRSCGTRSVNGDPVVCCTRPLVNVRPAPGPVTPAPPNPFVTVPRPDFTPVTANPFVTRQPTALPTRPSTTRVPTPTTTTTTVRTTTTTITTTPAAPENLVETRGPYCRGPDVREGFCIPLKSCQELVNELLAKQNDATFANFLRASNRICGGTGTTVCCPSADAQQQSGTSRPVRPVNSNEVPRRLPTVQEGCGYTSNSFKKIVGGEVSKKGAWPWVALIGYDDDFSASPFKCGGTLVTARHVVTAAHCIRNDLSFVRLGEHDLTTDTEAQHVDIPVVRSERHPEYNRRNGRSDIAVLYLQRNVEFTDSIAPICLPTTAALRQKSYVTNTPFVVGWGKTMEGGVSANVLQELQIPIYDNEVCVDRYRKQNRLFSDDQFDAAVICAGVLSGGMDTCQGDSGGPLMIPEPYMDKVRYYLIGIVSYGIGCARPQVPGVYTSVQYFMDWITQKIADTP